MRMPRLVTCIVTLAFAASLAACSTVKTSGVKNSSKTFSTVVVDAGHGGKDSGAFRRYGPPEKMVTLDVAQRLERELRESKMNTVMTRDSDVFIPLNDRVAMENSRKMQSLLASILTTRASARPADLRPIIIPVRHSIWPTWYSKNS